jgi:hypothetical protein
VRTKLLLLAALEVGTHQVLAQAAPGDSQASHHELDFWVGDWEAFAEGKLDGTDRIEKTLNGAAVTEFWRDSNGHDGKSLFYFYRPENRWKQIWVTDTGGVKEKACIEVFPQGGLLFRGEATLRDGRRVLDQTRLTPLPDGTVRQVIEQSSDGGESWVVSYNAIYRRKHPD